MSFSVRSEVCITPFVAYTSSHLSAEDPKSLILSVDGAKLLFIVVRLEAS